MKLSIDDLKELSGLFNEFIEFLENKESADEPTLDPIPEPILPNISIDELADQVLDGKWGSGDTRKKRLEEAGYDYDKIQEKVNEILKIVQEVLDGKWGNGDTRKQRLTEAGYNYDIIQNQINRQLDKENP